MKNIKRWAAAAMAMVAVAGAQAQGNEGGQGGNDEGIVSISERLLHVEKKSDAFNVFMNLNTSYQEQFDGEDEGGSFKGRQIRFELKGTLDKHWSYRFRYRLNRPGAQQDDNFSNNIDFMQVNYQFNDRWRLTAGKKEITPGGFEWDFNPIQILQYSDFVDGLTEFHMGLQAGLKIAKGHELMAEIYNANNDRVEKMYAGAGLERSKHPLGGAINWTGNMLGGKLQTLWTFIGMKEAKNTSTYMITLGQRLNLKRWQLYVDYYGAWEGVDRHGIVSSEIGSVAKDVRYHTVVAEVNVQPHSHWNLMAKGMMEKATVKNNEALRNYRTSWGYQVAVQWYPDLTQNCKLSLAYIGKSVKYKSAAALQDYNRNRIELSMIYRLKLY